LPAFLDYRKQIEAHSILNTPPVFSIYTILLVTRWLLQDIGGLHRMQQINQSKADTLYGALDASEGFYQSRTAIVDRSMMNVSFRLPSPELDAQFLAQASAAGYAGLAGHRAVGGIRASIYNAVTPTAVENLVDFMAEFKRLKTN
jgi:phosphoserine aminotransferase